MNALNPVRRVRDQIAEPIEERLGQSRDRRRASGPASCSSSSGSRGSAASAYPHELSGGMRQRAMIAMALACDPAIVIGDEPTTALDVMVQAQILELLEDLRHKLGLSLILITHDLSVIAETCDRVDDHVRRPGRRGGPGRARSSARPRHPYTQKLLAAFPNIHADRRTLDVIPGSPPDLRNPPPGCRFAPRCAFAMDVCTRGRAARGHVRTASGSPATCTRSGERRRADHGPAGTARAADDATAGSTAADGGPGMTDPTALDAAA